MTRIIKLFVAAALAGLAIPAAAQQAQTGAQTSVPLTPDQKQAISIARGFNNCVREGDADPAYAADKKAYDQAIDLAQKDFERDKQAYIEATRAFNKAYDVIATRDGEGALIDELNRRYSDLDKNGDDYFAAQAVLETQINVLRDHVQAKVVAETGMVLPVYPQNAKERVTVPQPQDPLRRCGTVLRETLESKNLHEWTFRSTLSDVMQQQGVRKYNELTGGPALP
jgi:hypothetical protein